MTDFESRTPLVLTWNPPIGSRNEPPISNVQFLQNFLDFGVWLRASVARTLLPKASSEAAPPLERLSHLASFFQVAGAAMEDTIVSLVAWTAWSQNKSLLLPDLLDRIVVRTAGSPKISTGNHFDQVRHALSHSTKRVDIFPAPYFQGVLAHSKSDLPAILGVPWKREPSVKLVPRHSRDSWLMLPDIIFNLSRTFAEGLSPQLGPIYNKLKHGPQMVVMRPSEAAERRDSIEVLLKSVGLDVPTIRILKEGACTQRPRGEGLDDREPAPFLVQPELALEIWYFEVILHHATSMNLLAKWLYRCSYPELDVDVNEVNDHAKALIQEQMSWARENWAVIELMNRERNSRT